MDDREHMQGKEVGIRTDAKLRIGTRKHRGDRLGGKGARKPAKVMGWKENPGAGRCNGTAAHHQQMQKNNAAIKQSCKEGRIKGQTCM